MLIEESRWAAKLRDAQAGSAIANIIWLGDSISELNATGNPIPWQLGELLSNRVETVQYRRASDNAYVNPLSSAAGAPPDPECGLGGRSVLLEVGQRARVEVGGQALSVVWTRRPDAGQLRVTWGDGVMGVIDTEGVVAHSRLSVFTRSDGSSPVELVIESQGGTSVLEGVYVHQHNAHQGVRVWPAVRSGSTSLDFLENPGWVLDALDTIRPDLVVVGTGTNDDDYEGDVSRLVTGIQARRPETDVALWLAPISSQFTPDHAEAGRRVAQRLGCLLIDGAGALGRLPTLDGVHPASITSAIAAGHAAAAIAPGIVAASLLSQVVSSLHREQEWSPGAGTISVSTKLGGAVLAGRVHQDDPELAWGLSASRPVLDLIGLPGPTLGLGPGGSMPMDTFLSRAGVGSLAVNSGSGQVDLARLRLTPAERVDSGLPDPVLTARDTGGRAELIASFPGGATTVLANSMGSQGGFLAPVPCAVSSLRASGVGTVLERGVVMWMPLPVLAAPARATDIWLEVVSAQAGVSVTAAVVSTAADGRPGAVVTSTGPAGIELEGSGVFGAALVDAVVLDAGVRWWVAVLVASGSDPTFMGGDPASDWPSVQLGSAPVRPTAGPIGLGFCLAGQSRIPDHPGPSIGHRPGRDPMFHVSLTAP